MEMELKNPYTRFFYLNKLIRGILRLLGFKLELEIFLSERGIQRLDVLRARLAGRTGKRSSYASVFEDALRVADMLRRAEEEGCLVCVADPADGRRWRVPLVVDPIERSSNGGR